MGINKEHIQVSFFLDLFFNKKSFPLFYKKITNTILNTVLYNTDANSTIKFKHQTYCVKDIPDYFFTKIAATNTPLKQLTAPLYPGYLINLTAFKDLEDYLNNKLGRPRKSQLRRYRKRLDLCIAPEYKIYCGGISKKEYKLLFKELKVITQQRFAQKEELNFELPYLDLYEDMMLDMVLKKQAAIFVIYHDKKPINITLNFTNQDTIFHWNSCYNIDYQMFNLGHINMVNHLEWAFNNGFKLFDMSRGDFLHKRKYVNQSYMYTEIIYFNSKSVSAFMQAHFKILKLKMRYQLILLLKKVNFHKIYGRYAKFKYRITNSSNSKTTKEHIIVEYNILKLPELENLKLINSKEEFEFLIKPLNYFLHKSQEYVDEVKIYANLNDDKIFYFKGNKKQQKITIKKQL